MSKAMPSAQRGFLLIAVLVTLFLLAAIGLLLATEGGADADRTASASEALQADYLAQAGLRHALFQNDLRTCSGNFTIPTTPLGANSYSAAATGGSSATAQSFSVDQDAWIRSDQPTTNNGTAATQHIRFESGNVEHALFRFDVSSLPAGSRINSASASFYVSPGGGGGGAHPQGPMTIHRVTADWTAANATWNSMNGKFDPQVLAMITPQAATGVWVSVNLTAAVQAWVNGAPNYGILLASAAEAVHGQYVSSEGTVAERPRLDVIVGSGAYSPVNLQATGTLANGVTRNLSRAGVTGHQATTGAHLQPFGDTVLKQDVPTLNFGASTDLWVEDAVGGAPDNSLFGFNLVVIPSGAWMTSATLEVYAYSDLSTATGSSIGVHRVTWDWVAGTNNGTAGSGATWNQSVPGTSWTSAGGDYDRTPFATVEAPAGSTGWRQWDVTSLVNGWSTGAFPTQGLVLAAANGTTRVAFRSSEYSDPSQRPKLTITYACDCGSACLAPQGSGRVLMVVINPTTLVADDAAKRALFESWGYTVNIIGESENVATFASQAANNDVIFISESVNSSQVGTKVAGLSIGVVSQDGAYNSDIGFSSGSAQSVSAGITVTDASHYITSVFPAGSLDIYSGGMEQLTVSGTAAPGLQALASTGAAGSLVVLEMGALRAGGGTAAGRRVMLPLGRDAKLNWSRLNNNGRLLVQRALAWGMNADIVAGSADKLLLVVVNPSSLTSQEQAKKTLIEGWGYAVSLIDESDSQSVYNTALAANDVVFVTEDVNASSVGTKLSAATIGVVIEEDNLSDELGLSAGIAWESGTAIQIIDNTHYITSPFPTGLLTVFTASQSLAYVTGAQSAGLARLARSSSGYGVVALESGAATHTGGTNPGRRAMLPWGGDSMNVSSLNADGLTIFERALEWAAGNGAAASSGPIAHWKLDEISGSTAVDSAGSNDGTVMNGAVWVTGKVDGGLSFDGNNDYIEVSSLNPRIYDDLTISAWYKSAQSSVSDDEYIFSHFDDSTNTILFGPTDDGGERLRFGFNVGGTFFPHYGTSDVVDQQWHHLVAVRSGGRVRLYVDNVKQTDQPDNFAGVSVDIDGDGPFIGDDPGNSEQVHGILDDVRLYDRGLSDAEVAELFALGGGGGGGGETFRDEFMTAGSYAGSDGTLPWATTWLEVNESDGASSGDERVLSAVGGIAAQVQDNDSGGEGLSREANLSGYTNAVLSFLAWRSGLDDANDFVTIDVSANGGSTWTEIGRIAGPGTDADASPLSLSFDISAHIATNTRIRFLTSSSMGGSDRVYLDDVQIEVN